MMADKKTRIGTIYVGPDPEGAAERDRLKAELGKAQKSRDWYMLKNIKARDALKSIEQMSTCTRRLGTNMNCINQEARKALYQK